MQVSTRAGFGSRLGFVLAASGSAIGLGNIWRFPYSAGENGGAPFVVIYLVFVALIGIPVLWAELALGRATQRNPVGAFRAAVPSRWWPWIGGLGVVTGFGILAFYSVVAGWTFGYLYKAASGQFRGGLDADQSGAIFAQFISDAGTTIPLAALFLALTVLVVCGGVQRGIELSAKILMPLFALLLVLLAIRSLSLPGASQGLEFLFSPDFSKITPKVVLGALGQALFSLSLGMGAMITYGSYLRKEDNLVVAGLTVAVFDTLIALLAGLLIFPALFSVGVDPSGGAGLVFVVLPTIFDALPAGNLFAIAFYALLAIAALTSTISLLEVVVAYFVDEHGWSRGWIATAVGGGAFALAVPSALSFGASPWLTAFLGKGFLEVNNILFGNLSLSIGAFFLCVFVGWKWGLRSMLDEIEAGGHALPASGLFGILIRFVCPLAVAGVLGFLLYTGEFL